MFASFKNLWRPKVFVEEKKEAQLFDITGDNKDSEEVTLFFGAVEEKKEAQLFDIAGDDKDSEEVTLFFGAIEENILCGATFTRCGFKTLPFELQRQDKSLRLLSFANNKIEILPNDLSIFKNLTLVNFSHNSLGSLPKCIVALKRLKQIKLRYNQFTEIPEILIQVTSLQYFDLTGNELRGIPPELFGPFLKQVGRNLSNPSDENPLEWGRIDARRGSKVPIAPISGNCLVHSTSSLKNEPIYSSLKNEPIYGNLVDREEYPLSRRVPTSA